MHQFNTCFLGAAACRLLPVSVGVLLAGCGLRVPPIDEFGNHVEQQRFVAAVATNINCELKNAFNDLREHNPQGTFLDGNKWGVQTTLTLSYR